MFCRDRLATMVERVLRVKETPQLTYCFSSRDRYMRRSQRLSSPQILPMNKIRMALVQGKAGIRVRG